MVLTEESSATLVFHLEVTKREKSSSRLVARVTFLASRRLAECQRIVRMDWAPVGSDLTCGCRRSSRVYRQRRSGLVGEEAQVVAHWTRPLLLMLLVLRRSLA